MKTFAEIAFTPTVRAAQQAEGSRANYARLDVRPGPAGLGEAEAGFLEAADTFYLATVGETGWPYVQHRGGPPGFMRVVGPTRLAFADFRGNRQLVSAGNAVADGRASMLVIDPVERRRLKLLGRLRFVPLAEADAALVDAVDTGGYRARVERIATMEVEAFDWNCPQHIVQRYTRAEVEAMAAPLLERIAALEARLARSGPADGSPKPA